MAGDQENLAGTLLKLGRASSNRSPVLLATNVNARQNLQLVYFLELGNGSLGLPRMLPTRQLR